MKLKKIKLSLLATCTLVAVYSCGNDFLDVSPKGSALEANYYKNETEAYSGLVSVYDAIKKNSGGTSNYLFYFNSGSDDHYSGGANSTDGASIQAFANYTIASDNVDESLWSDNFQGIFRANTLLLKLPEIDMDAAAKVRFTAETKALRAYFYFSLVRIFKNVPLITKPLSASEYYSVKQAAPKDVYTQIIKDLTEALPGLPIVLPNPSTEAGRFSQGAAKALLGKVYLYNGDNANAAAQLAEVNGTPGGTSKYGYKLLAKFADLWNTTNKFNSEGIIEVSHTQAGLTDWGTPVGSGADEGNHYALQSGIRSYKLLPGSDAPNNNSGWGYSPLTQELYDLLKADPRFSATVVDAKALKAAGKIDYEESYKGLGYYVKKFAPTSVESFGSNPLLNYRQNSYIIRLADTYLMEAEALGGSGARAQALLDAVRARVGLASVPVSMTAIMAERRLELACEGHRWFDLVRTGKAAAALSNRGFVAGKNEIWPIPLKELENTAMVQNPGYN